MPCLGLQGLSCAVQTTGFCLWHGLLPLQYWCLTSAALLLNNEQQPTTTTNCKPQEPFYYVQSDCPNMLVIPSYANCRVTGCHQTDGLVPTAAQTGSAASAAAMCARHMQLQHLPRRTGLPGKSRKIPDSHFCA